MSRSAIRRCRWQCHLRSCVTVADRSAGGSCDGAKPSADNGEDGVKVDIWDIADKEEEGDVLAVAVDNMVHCVAEPGVSSRPGAWSAL